MWIREADAHNVVSMQQRCSASNATPTLFGTASPCFRATCISHPLLIVIPLRKRNENADGNGSGYKRTKNSLEEDCVLDLSQSRFLDPDLTIKDFTQDVAFLVFGDPGLVLIAGAAAESVEGSFAEFEFRGRIIIFCEQLPRTKMAMMHAVENLVMSDNRQERQSSPTLTTHIPFHAAISVATPIRNPIADRALQSRPALLRVMSMAATRPAMIPATLRPRAKITRGRLPLQILQRMKLRCAW